MDNTDLDGAERHEGRWSPSLYGAIKRLWLLCHFLMRWDRFNGIHGWNDDFIFSKHKIHNQKPCLMLWTLGHWETNYPQFHLGGKSLTDNRNSNGNWPEVIWVSLLLINSLTSRLENRTTCCSWRAQTLNRILRKSWFILFFFFSSKSDFGTCPISVTQGSVKLQINMFWP